MKLSLFPRNSADQALVYAGISAVAAALIAAYIRDYEWAIIFGLLALGALIWAYGYPEEPLQTTEPEEYSIVIKSIGGIRKKLSELSVFLERERAKIADTEATVRRLNEEKANLEPVVFTQRETVEAILAAHAMRTAKNAWKERFIGFAFGALASLLASTVYDYLKR